LCVGRSDDIRPAGLCVDLEPNGELVGLAVLTASVRRRRDDAERDGCNNRHENSCSHPRLLEPSTRDLGALMPLWLCGTRARVVASNWYLPMATAGDSHTRPPVSRSSPERCEID